MVGVAYGGMAVGVGLFPVVVGAATLVGIGVLVGAAVRGSGGYRAVSTVSPAGAGTVVINGRRYRLVC